MAEPTFQTFDVKSDPSQGAARVARLRAAMADAGVAAFLVPRTDMFRGETVAECDARLAWLTGFTGSAGQAIVARDRAVIFVDGRYRLQVRNQVDGAVFDFAAIPQDTAADWLTEALAAEETVGYDPWLHTPDEVDRLAKALAPAGLTMAATDNLVDAVWDDRPAPPAAPAQVHGLDHAGEDHAAKRARIAEVLAENGADCAVITVPESIAWLLNIRGGDVAHTPVVHATAILHQDASVRLFVDAGKIDPPVRDHLGPDVSTDPPGAFAGALAALSGTVQIDKTTAPVAVRDLCAAATVIWQRDPCTLPRACKNPAELAGARAAQARDAVAVISFLAWLDAEAPSGTLTEIDAARRLEHCRRATNALRDISFETISGAGANGAIVHYRVTTETNAALRPGSLYLVDSGGQYADGTTDITRTITIGDPPDGAAQAFTLVLKGMIAMSSVRWPPGLAGRDLDGFARAALWRAGFDYDHGTGHGVGAYLGVHEGPAALSRRSVEPLLPGMILSNEPGYYREGAFGIRIENLLAITDPSVPDGGDRPMLGFETLTYVPIDRRLIDRDLLTEEERDWLNRYHREVLARHHPALPVAEQAWLTAACAPI